MIQIKIEYNFNNNLGSLWVAADSIDQANAIAKTLLRRKYGSTEDLGYLLDMYITEIKVKSKINGK